MFISDNGLMLGSHRLDGKDVPYDRSTHVPMLIRWDNHLPAGITDDRITTNTDLTATIAEATGTTWPMEGRSYLSANRSGTLLEQVAYLEHPAYCGWRNKRYLYVVYEPGQGTELYDYATDPDELTNVVTEATYDRVEAKLRAKVKTACIPKPPGFSWRIGVKR